MRSNSEPPVYREVQRWGKLWIQVEPYWHDLKCGVKDRWIGQRVLEVLQQEFSAWRDIPEYWHRALQEGRLLIDEKPFPPHRVFTKHDRFLTHRLHLHEVRFLYRSWIFQVYAHSRSARYSSNNSTCTRRNRTGRNTRRREARRHACASNRPVSVLIII